MRRMASDDGVTHLAITFVVRHLPQEGSLAPTLPCVGVNVTTRASELVCVPGPAYVSVCEPVPVSVVCACVGVSDDESRRC